MVGVNKKRGEISARIGGSDWRLCLTLGGLAELEDYFSCPDLVSLGERFESGRLSARDCIAIIGAGLRGGGHEITDEAVATLFHGQGAAGYIGIVSDLLVATFGSAAQEGDAERPL